jgi:ComF family protein
VSRSAAPPALPRRLWTIIADLLFPPRCGGCGAVGSWLCAGCIAQIEPPYPEGWTCGGCGSAEWGACRRCQAPALAGFLVVGAFDGPLRAAIHRLKYNRQRALAPALARLLALGLEHTPAPWNGAAPLLLAVPLHPARTRERGFSQTDLLAEALAAQSAYPLLAGLHRIRATPPQVGLSAAQRRVNVAGAFAWQGSAPPPPGPLLLVDDVYTSGATLAAAAQALRAAGSGPVYGVALARPRTI